MKPGGYKENHRGHLVPISTIPDVELMRDDLVKEMVSEAKAMQETMREFKRKCFGDIDAFVDLSLSKYQVKIGGKKGNITLVSFDGKMKVQFSVGEFMSFDERIQGAKTLIDECLSEWTGESHEMLKALVNDIFDVDKAGKINVRKMLTLRRHYKSDDARWEKAMDIISDSLQVLSTKAYLRLYEKSGEDEKYTPISLDMANI